MAARGFRSRYARDVRRPARRSSADTVCHLLGIELAHLQRGIKRLKFDGNYFVKGFWGEIYAGIVLEGLGPEAACVTYMGDQGWRWRYRGF